MGGGGKSGGAGGDIQSALNAQLQAIQQATADINKYSGMSVDQLQQTYKEAQNQLTNYTALGMAQTAPYNFAGTNALDAYNATLGIGAPTGGSFNLQQALTGQQTYDQAKAAYQQNLANYNQQMGIAQPVGGVSPNAAANAYVNPTTLTAQKEGIANPTLQNWYQGLQSRIGNEPASQLQQEIQTEINKNQAVLGSIGASGVPDRQQYIQSLQDLQAKLGQTAPVSPTAPTNTLTPEQQATAAAYKAGTLGTQAAGNPLAGFAGSAQGKLMNYDPNQSILQNFYNSNPSFQFQQQQMNAGINASASSQGMLNNPNLLRSLQNYNQNLASTTFGQYQQNLGQAFSGYQNSLANLAGAGQQIATQNQGALQGTGATLSGQTIGQGQDISSVYQNQASQLANAQLGAGQAQASSYMNQANLGQQQAAGGSALGGLVGRGIGTYFGGGMGGAIGSGLGGLVGSIF